MSSSSVGVLVSSALLAAACGSVPTGQHAADAAADGAGALDGAADAIVVDAAPPDATFSSVVDFPTPHTTIAAFSNSEYSAAGITSSNVGGGGGSLTGNTAAPMSGTFLGIGSTATTIRWTFATPIHAVGISATDIDFSNDNAVVVRLAGLDGDDAELLFRTDTIQPANTGDEENGNAVFVGWFTARDVATVTLTIDQANSTALDNLVFQ